MTALRDRHSTVRDRARHILKSQSREGEIRALLALLSSDSKGDQELAKSALMGCGPNAIGLVEHYIMDEKTQCGREVALEILEALCRSHGKSVSPAVLAKVRDTAP